MLQPRSTRLFTSNSYIPKRDFCEGVAHVSTPPFVHVSLFIYFGQINFDPIASVVPKTETD